MAMNGRGHVTFYFYVRSLGNKEQRVPPNKNVYREQRVPFQVDSWWVGAVCFNFVV